MRKNIVSQFFGFFFCNHYGTLPEASLVRSHRGDSPAEFLLQLLAVLDL